MNANDFSQPKQSIYKDCNSLTDDMNQSIENASTILDGDENSEIGEVTVSNQMLMLLCCRRCLLNVYSNAVCLWELWAVFVVTTTTIAVIAFLVHTFPEYFETDKSIHADSQLDTFLGRNMSTRFLVEFKTSDI